jgi:sarcosine oxidase subunit alpha
MPMRLPPQDAEVIDRRHAFAIRWNGAEYPAYEGDTIVSALAAAGEHAFSRSFKYHRPRGLLTADLHDPGCILQVDGEPNVRGAHRLAKPGMDVWAQNTWPSLRFDLKAVNRVLGRWLTPGFYYKTFMRPRRLWPWYESVLRRYAPGGSVPGAPMGSYGHEHAHPDVLVVGGGPAGMTAAAAAAEAGAAVMLVEERHHLGGHLLWGSESDREVCARLQASVARADGIDVRTDASAIGVYDDRLVAVVQRAAFGPDERLVKVRPQVLVVATGLIERPYVFAGNDLPGVMLSTAVRRLVNHYAVRPGRRAVVLTANPSGDAAAEDLARVGVQVVRIVDARRGEDIIRAVGRRHVRQVECGDGRIVDCDLVVTATGWSATTALPEMLGSRPVYDDTVARSVPGPLPPGVHVTGDLVGDRTLTDLLAHARAVGAAAAGEAGRGVIGCPTAPPVRAVRHPARFAGATPGVVDFSEDVTSTDLVLAVREGYDSAELAKRYTAAGMGATQGKIEGMNTAAVLAAATGRSLGDVGTTTSRPPWVPVTLGALAGFQHEPARRSSLQAWHEEHGAVPLVAGPWIRPDHYGDPAAEARHVRQHVGIVDVTPLGKVDLRGPDVPDLLDQLYVNRWQKLAVGSVRYGVMCGDDGVVLDDGVTGRLSDDRYLMTTTSTGAEAVEERIARWLQVERPHWRVHMLPVTAAYASINVAGPRSRELVARLTDVDVSPEAFPYLCVRTGRVAGVAGCLMWRIGFTGELSYELHVPSGYGMHVWEALLSHGADLGVRPFGVEAQRILRLEKGHLIVGQDTDSLTHAFAAGVGWAVKADKDDFAGKPELVAQGSDDRYPHLVGLQPEDPAVVPPEGSLIVDQNGLIVGRITSSRMSATLDRSVCLGFVAPHLATPGTVVEVRLPRGQAARARVMEQMAHVDPEGRRLRV